MNRKGTIGSAIGVSAAAILYFLPLPHLPAEARRCLALTVGAIFFWMFEVIPSGFTAMGLVLGFLLAVDPGSITPADAFGFWLMPMAYMVLGGFLIAGAVRESGLGRRLALWFIGRFVRTYDDILISCYIISYILALLIPQVMPRAFLLLSVMNMLVESAHIEKKYAFQVTTAVFGAQSAASMMFMTGEASLNTVILAQLPAGASIGWLQWLLWMCVPALLIGATRCFVQLRFFGRADITIDPTAVREELHRMGRLSAAEKKVIFWLTVAVILWSTSTLHGIDVGWVTLGVAFAMSLPVIGGVVKGSFLKDVNLNAMLFMTATLAIGTVGTKTGMSGFLSGLILPETLSGGVMNFILLTMGVCMAMHLCVGGIMSVFALIGPALIAAGATVGLPPQLSALAIYLVTYGQWIFPYQNLSMALALGDDSEGGSSWLLTKFGLLCTLPTLMCVLAAFGWWKLLGLY